MLLLLLFYQSVPRPKSSKPPKRPIMEPEFREELQQTRIQEYQMRTVMKDLTIYFIYVALIVIISYGNRDPNAYLEKEALQQAVVHGALNCGQKIQEYLLRN